MELSWDQRYDSEAYVYGTEPNDWFVEKLKIIKPGKLLLPAEGEGRNAVWAASQEWEVTAFDQSTVGKNKAIRLAASKNVVIDYMIQDIRSYRGKENLFDAVGLIFVQLPPEYRIKFHAELIKSLKPGGCMIVEAFSKAQLHNNSGGPKNEELLYDPDELRSDFDSLKILEFHSVKVHLQEGKLHHGIADVIRLFARKK